MVVIRATNRLEILGPALRRAVRFDREIALGIPDRGFRERILAVVGRDLKLAQGTDLGRLPMLSPGHVGADLTSLVREAAMAAVNRCLGVALPDQEDKRPWFGAEGVQVTSYRYQFCLNYSLQTIDKRFFPGAGVQSACSCSCRLASISQCSNSDKFVMLKPEVERPIYCFTILDILIEFDCVMLLDLG